MIESLQSQLQNGGGLSVSVKQPIVAEIVVDSNNSSKVVTTVVGFNNMFSKRGFTGISKYKTPDVANVDATS